MNNRPLRQFVRSFGTVGFKCGAASFEIDSRSKEFLLGAVSNCETRSSKGGGLSSGRAPVYNGTIKLRSSII